MARVLILREREAARETAKALVDAGHEPQVLPLEAYRTLDLSAGLGGSAWPTGDRSAAFAAFLLTSPRAVPALCAFTADRSRRVFAVGERTAEAARRGRFRHVISAGGDAAALAEVVAAADFPPGARLLYAAGETRTATLEAELSGLDVEVVVRNAYATVRLAADAAAVDAALSNGPPDVVLVLSAGQATAFCDLAERMPERFLPQPRIVAFSARIAAALTPPFGDLAVISREPTMVSLFERLD